MNSLSNSSTFSCEFKAQLSVSKYEFGTKSKFPVFPGAEVPWDIYSGSFCKSWPDYFSKDGVLFT